MKEKSKIFKAEEITELLKGTKTRFCVPMKVEPVLQENGFFRVYDAMWKTTSGSVNVVKGHSLAYKSPYGTQGDRVWVRETYREYDPYIDGCDCEYPCLHYKPFIYFQDKCAIHDVDIKWKPSTHMPRHASRITLEITSVKIERLQDSSEECLLEELGDMLEDPDSLAGKAFNHAEHLQIAGVNIGMTPEMHGFKAFWDNQYGKGSFDSNPWVWVYDFKLLEGK